MCWEHCLAKIGSCKSTILMYCTNVFQAIIVTLECLMTNRDVKSCFYVIWWGKVFFWFCYLDWAHIKPSCWVASAKLSMYDDSKLSAHMYMINLLQPL